VADQRETRVDNPTRLTDSMRGAEPLPPAPQETPEQIPVDTSSAYVKEPLFSKRVLIGWAVGTLVVWFGLTVIVPAVVQSIKAAVVSSVPEDGDTRVIRTRNGTTITIKGGPDGGITVDRGGRGSAGGATTTRTVIAVPVEPTAGQPAPVPEPAAPREPTGKK
jgi:hypothetical protein